MPLLDLPIELFRPIIDSGLLDKGDLCSVALTSRPLRDEAQRILFRDPGMVLVRADHKSDGGRAFFNAILSSPNRLALMVHTYAQSVSWTDHTLGGKEKTLRGVQDELFKMMAEALKLMVNLVEFHSSGSGVPNNYSPGSMVDCLLQCRFKLKAFTWNHRGEEARLLEEFLTAQGDIQSLFLPQGFDIRGASDINNANMQRLLLAGTQACPKLETLHGPMSSSRVLLPGKRNVKFIGWIWALFLTEALDDTDLHITHICEALQSLQYLEYESGDAAGFPFTKIVPHLHSLVILTISSLRLREVSELSRGLPSLRAIDFFHEGFWNVFSSADFARDYTYVASIFRLCSKLQFIDVTRHLDSQMAHTRNQEGGPITRRFMISQETGEVTGKRIEKSEERWWKDRVQIVAELSLGA